MKKLALAAVFFVLFFTVNAQTKIQLTDGWRMQSFTVDSTPGAQVSQPGYTTSQWYKVSVPTTILAGLLANNEYSFDPFFGKNLDLISGPRFDKPWWFRKEFLLPVTQKGKNVILKVHGVNYKANIWLNGILIADTTQIKGPFRFFEIDITNLVKYNTVNVLAFDITRPFNPQKRGGDLAIDYADWIHYPADYNGGIINDVEVDSYDKVAIEHPLVDTKFDLPSLKVAHLTVYADVVNYTGQAADAIVKGNINGTVLFMQKVHLQPKERKEISFTPDDYAQLNIHNPTIWWPWQFGKPDLSNIQLSISRKGKISNTISEHFGIRQITSSFLTDKAREFIVNGKPIMLRGAAWSPDIFQRRSKTRQEQEVKLIRDMNINIVRSEGKLEDDNFYDLCDKNGFLVMTGWMCCGAWQYPERWTPAKRVVAMESDSSTMYWLRNRACVVAWLNGSDMPPRDTSVERSYLNIEANLHFAEPILSTANQSDSKVSGPSGVKMLGPYEWVPPSYWEQDTDSLGGAWSFATEISPGPSIPPYESLIKFLPKDSLADTSKDWRYHAGTGEFGSTHVFDTALLARYGASSTTQEYLAKAQAQDYEAHRAMMEAYGLNKHKTATGVVQWMLSNPWPGIIWHTYDYYLYPAGTYFGVKKALEPLHIQYSYKSKEVIVTNALLKEFTGLKVKADVYDIDGSLKFSKSVKTSVAKDAVTRCFAISPARGTSTTYLLRLQLTDESSKVQSINWYWLSSKDDSLNWQKSTWFYTPQSSFTDFTGLQQLPKTALKVATMTTKRADSTVNSVTITNAGKAVAFFVHLRATKGKDGDDILPVIFDDNYISLAPGETRRINCTYSNKDAGIVQPYFLLSSWNTDTNRSTKAKNIGVISAY